MKLIKQTTIFKTRARFQRLDVLAVIGQCGMYWIHHVYLHTLSFHLLWIFVCFIFCFLFLFLFFVFLLLCVLSFFVSPCSVSIFLFVLKHMDNFCSCFLLGQSLRAQHWDFASREMLQT